MLQRKIMKDLQSWKTSNENKCLIIEGARQVGKTYIVREFAKNSYDSFIELNFIENPSLKNIFADSLDVDTILMGIGLYMPGTKITEGATLLFLDEIQECSEAIAALKFLASDKRISVICSGSALGMRYKPTVSYPVGSVDYLKMYSLDFEEFLWAMGVEPSVLEIVAGSFPRIGDVVSKIPAAIHDRLMHFLRQYIVLGGMPEVVQTFVDSSDYYQADRVQRRLYQDYLMDIARYASPDIKIRAEKCFQSVPQQLVKENHKFQYSKIEHNGTSARFISCIDWLTNAHMAISVHNVSRIEYPLESYTEDNNFRLYYHDIGMLISTYGFELKAAILEDKDVSALPDGVILGAAKGGIYEALAADILNKAGFENLHFYRNATGTREIEFLLQTDEGIIPVEVKAGRTRTKSLNAILKDESIKYGYKFASQNIGISEKKITLPLYMLPLL